MDADAVIFHADDEFIFFLCPAYFNRVARLGILGGVVEQVADHLAEPYRIGVDVQRSRRRHDDDRMGAVVDQRAGAFDGIMDDVADLVSRAHASSGA